MVVKYNRQVKTGGIGVIRADMSVANSLGETANALSSMSNTAYKIAADKAVKKGRDYVSALADDEIFGISKDGKSVNLLNDIVTSLPTKGYGMRSQEVIESELTRRFQNIALIKMQKQSAKYEGMFPNNPKKYEEEMAGFLDELAAPYQGKYKQLIYTKGKQYAGGIATRLHLSNVQNELRKANLNFINDLEIERLNKNSIASTGSFETVKSMLEDTLNSKGRHEQDRDQRYTSSFNNPGGVKVSLERFKIDEAGEIAAMHMGKILNKLVKQDKVAFAHLAADINNGGLILESHPSGDTSNNDKARLAFLFNKYVKKSSTGLRTLTNEINRVNINDNKVRSAEAYDLKNILDSEVENLNLESANLAKSLLNQETPGSAEHEALINNLRTASLQGSDAFFKAYSKERAKISNAYDTLSKEIEGKTVFASSKVLGEHQKKRLINHLDKQASNIIRQQATNLFTNDKGQPDLVKLDALVSAVRSPDQSALIGKNAEFNAEQMKLLKVLPQLRKSKVGPADEITETTGGMSLDLRNKIASGLETYISDAKTQLTTQAAQSKNKDLFKSIAMGSTHVGAGKEQYKAIDSYLSDKFNIEEGLNANAYFTEMFAPGSPFRKEVEGIVRNSKVIPQSLVEALNGVAENKYDPNRVTMNYMVDFIKKMETADYNAKRLPDGQIIADAQLVNKLQGLVPDKTLNFLRQVSQAAEVSGTENFVNILRNYGNFKEGDEYQNMLNAFFPDDKSKNRATSMSKAIAAIPEIANSGGTGSYYHSKLMDAMPFWLYRNKNNIGSLDQAAINGWGKELMENLYVPTEDFVIDQFAFGDDLHNARSAFALKRIIPDETMRKDFIQYVNEKVKKVGNYSIIEGFRGDIDETPNTGIAGIDSPLTRFLSNMFEADTAENVGVQKVWLAADHGSSTGIRMTNSLSDGQDVFFTLVTSDGSDLVTLFNEDNSNLLRVSLREFFVQYNMENML